MHPLGRSDKRALKLPLLGFNVVIDPDSGMYVARSPRDPPRTSLISTDIDRSARRKNISDVSFTLLPLHTRTRKCPLVPGLESSELLYTCHARVQRPARRPTTTAHQTQPRRNTSRECDLLSRSLTQSASSTCAMAERSRSLKILLTRFSCSEWCA